MHSYIIDTEATVLEIDGEKWLIILTIFDYGSPEAKHLASQAYYELEKRVPNIIFAMKREDGTFCFIASDKMAAKIRARLLPNHPWKRVRLYPPPALGIERQVAL
jgi:hypothetical protein